MNVDRNEIIRKHAEARKRDETEAMRKYAEAHGCGERCKYKIDGQDEKSIYATFFCDNPERPLPCVRDEHGAIGQQTIKQLLQKINEELDELKAAVLNAFYGLDVIPAERPDLKNIAESYGDDMMKSIAEEAADTITAISTMLEALGIDAEMRDEAQRQVNERNRERGRL